MVEWCNDDYIDELKDKVDSLESHNTALRAMLGELEWCDYDFDESCSSCPACLAIELRGHSPDCRLAALLREGGEHSEKRCRACGTTGTCGCASPGWAYWPTQKGAADEQG